MPSVSGSSSAVSCRKPEATPGRAQNKATPRAAAFAGAATSHGVSMMMTSPSCFMRHIDGFGGAISPSSDIDAVVLSNSVILNLRSTEPLNELCGT